MLCSGYKCGVALLVLSAVLAGCAGNGEGLDANGQPIGSGDGGSNDGGGGGGGVTADLQSIEANVFAPICAQCHIGGSAPQGLQLDTAAHAYQFLVGVPSNEQPSVLRVKPGDPDSSYLYQKITGASGIAGGQMPLGQAPLPAATIAAIRQWIVNGALNVAASGSPPSLTAKLQLGRPEAFAVTATAPLDGDVIDAPLRTIVVAFNQEVDASLVNDTNITLEALVDGQARPLTATASLAVSNPSSIVIQPATALTPGQYRLTVRGTGGGALADIEAQSLGADFSFVFTVSPAQ
jgi:hypothetical protein